MNESAITIRRLVPDDWPLFRELRLQALRDAPDAFSSVLADWQGERDTEERWRQRLENVPFNAIGYLDGVSSGMVSGTKPNVEGVIELISMWVAPFARAKGVADALVTAVAEWASGEHADKLSLEVVEANARARAFYRRHGFVDVGPVEQAASGQPERRMLRTIGSESRSS